MSSDRKSRAGIARVQIDGIADHRDRRIGNEERFVIAMNEDRSALITVDANTPEVAESLAIAFWEQQELAGKPEVTIVRRDPLPKPTEAAWALAALQDAIDQAEGATTDAKRARDELIRSNAELGPTDVAAITGLTKGRIPQIRGE